MSTNELTKNALAASLKSLMHSMPINKITVQQICDKCNISRRTFYYHFQDTYELLGWIYEHEVIDDLEKYYSTDNWKNGVNLVLQYTLNNKEICLNTYNSLGREYLERFLYKIFYTALYEVIKKISSEMNVREEMKKECAQFYTLAVTGEFLLWLNHGLKDSPHVIADKIDTMLDGTLLAFLKKHDYNKTSQFS